MFKTVTVLVVCPATNAQMPLLRPLDNVRRRRAPYASRMSPTMLAASLKPLLSGNRSSRDLPPVYPTSLAGLSRNDRPCTP